MSDSLGGYGQKGTTSPGIMVINSKPNEANANCLSVVLFLLSFEVVPGVPDVVRWTNS